MAWTSGHKLQDGKYTIEQELGEGGFVMTYRARDNHGRNVIIKTLNENVPCRPDFAEFQQDFINKVISLGTCTHPHLVRIDNLFPEQRLWCTVMEYIDGENLGRRVEKQGVLSEDDALQYIQQIGEALTVIHNQGFLHREVKPQNIILRPTKKEAVLINFGAPFKFIPKTSTKRFLDGFAPMEEYDNGAKRDAYTDVYGLAATLYFLLTGKVPTIPHLRVDGITLELNPSINNEVKQAILKGMELKAKDRPQSIQEWLALFPLMPLALGLSITSAAGVDYSKLRNLLAAKQWEEADKETAERMLEVAGREEEGYLNDESSDIENFPCEDLRIIDQLWVKYSNGRFGFSVQKSIWESVNRDWDKFCKGVGWLENNGEELLESDLNFTLKAPLGHLPAIFRPSTGTVKVIVDGGLVSDGGCWSEDFEPGYVDTSGSYERDWYEMYEYGDIFYRLAECGL
jgi:serine/threonine protein kinase